MLRLKRKAGQSVVVDEAVVITVEAVAIGGVTLRLTVPKVSSGLVPLNLGAELPIVRGTETVLARLSRIDRGEAWLEFDGPRSVHIRRQEREKRSDL